jgi:ParB family chromosome partitioning protein
MVFESDSYPQIIEKKSLHEFADLQPIALSAINSEDKTFRITTITEIHELAASIQQLGLFHPPVVKQHRSEYITVSGFRRIAACRHIGWSEIPVSVLSSDTGNETCVFYAIADNSFQRPLNLVEISRSLFLLSAFVDDQNLLLNYASALGLPHHRDHVEKIKKICQLPAPIQDAVLADTISLPVALDLSKFESDTAIDLVKLFDHLKIGINKQRELILLLNEISLREKIPLQNLLNGKDVQQILAKNELDRVQMSRQIKDYLMRRRFPIIFNTKAKFEKIVNALKLGETIKLIPPKDFEGTTYTLTSQFKSHAELLELQSKLDTIIRNPELKEFLSDLKFEVI